MSRIFRWASGRHAIAGKCPSLPPFRTEPAKLSPHQTSGFEEAADREGNPLLFSVEDQRDNVADDQACQNSTPTAFNKPTSGCPSATIPREC